MSRGFVQGKDHFAIVKDIDNNTDEVPSHVTEAMKDPTTGYVAMDYGSHIWCRPDKDGGSGYFLNVSHSSDTSRIKQFSTEGITASQYRYENDEWFIEPFMAKEDSDVVTKKMLMQEINRLEDTIKELKDIIHERNHRHG